MTFLIIVIKIIFTADELTFLLPSCLRSFPYSLAFFPFFSFISAYLTNICTNVWGEGVTDVVNSISIFFFHFQNLLVLTRTSLWQFPLDSIIDLTMIDEVIGCLLLMHSSSLSTRSFRFCFDCLILFLSVCCLFEFEIQKATNKSRWNGWSKRIKWGTRKYSVVFTACYQNERTQMYFQPYERRHFSIF